MASGGTAEVLLNVLNTEEYNLIPEDVRAKITSHFEERFEEFLTSKALFESSRTKHEDERQTLGKDLEESQIELRSTKASLAETETELKLFHSKVEELKTDLSTLRESVKNYEFENSELRRQRNEAADERDSLTRMVERRDAELERLREDIKVLSAELSSAVNAKCEALANAEEVESKRAALDFREKSFEQEREFMKNKIASLTAELNKTNAELAILSRTKAADVVSFKSQLEAKTEELKIVLEKDAKLTDANNELVERIESLSAKLMSQREAEATIVDNYQQELQAKTKLADLYQRMTEDANAKSQELADAVRSLQRLLEESNKQYSDLKAELIDKESKLNQTIEAKNACIVALKQELKDANDLMKTSKLTAMEKAIEGMSPAAAAASKLMKSGLSLTQIYTQYVSVYEELTLQKEENRKLNLYINTIVQELEEKAPILKKQRENYESALESIASLCKQNDQLVEESRVLREEAREGKKLAGHHERENERMKKEISDLSRQVCFLVKAVEEARGGVISSYDSMNSSHNGSFGANDIISKKLVTFRDIEDLQENNKKLLALVRELSNKHEEMEANRPEIDMSMLHEQVNGLTAELLASKEHLSQQAALVEQLVRQRDLYRDMYQKTIKGDPNQQETLQRSEVTPVASPVKPPHSTVDAGVLASKQRALEEADKRLSITEKQLNELRVEYEEYRRERRTNEDMLTEQIDKLRSQVRELTNDKLKLTTQAEFQSERFKALLANGSGQKAQITALEAKCKTYSEMIAKHELSLKALMQESLNSQAKLSRAEVEVDSLRQECSLLRESEARLKREREGRQRESSGQTMLLANLESIKMTLERTETEGRLKLEQRLDECTRECIALRKRLSEEQENFKELSRHLERQTAAAVAREEEERKLAQEARQELTVAREELQKKQSEAEILEAKLREATRTPPVVVQRNDEQLTTRVRELESKLISSEGEIASLKQQVENSRKHLQQYTDIASSSEQQLNEFASMHEALKSDLEKKLTVSQRKEESLTAELSKLQAELSHLRTAGSQTSSDLQVRVKELEMQCKQANELLRQTSQSSDNFKAELQALKEERDASLKAQQESEEKYAHEVTLHSNDIQTMCRLKEELSSVNALMSELHEARRSAEEALEVGRALFEDREKLMKSQMEEQQQRLNDLEKQNTLLHDQIEALGTQLTVLQAQVGSPSKHSASAGATNTSASSSSVDGEDFRGPDQLLAVIKFLRREKELAVTRMEVLSTENSRLRAEHDVLVKQTQESVEALEQMKQREQSDTVTAARHQDLLRKVETLNAITDSNRLLREERDALRTKEQELVTRIAALEQELNPLREKHTNLSNQIESVRAENNNLKTELTKWRQRVNQLIERANKNSPEDWKRLTNERESLAKQLSAERSSLSNSQDELRMLKLEKTKVEEQSQLLSQRHNALEAEFRKNQETAKKQVEELNGLRSRVATLESELQEQKNNSSKVIDEVSKLNADITARETREQQIRKIAKKYKAQFEELKKSTDEERAQWETQRAQHENQAAAGMLTPEIKEQLREEGRREVEQKLRDAETTHTDQVRELTTQVTSSQEEAGTLRREIETFKSSEERAKTVLKNARSRIMLLTEQKAAIEKQLSESRSSTRDESEARLSVLKSQYEGRIARLEKEKADAVAERSREIENLSARLNHLQRVYENRAQGSSKPSTSSHVEKSSSEPPTANIKPMAGPSSSSGKQQNQQTVTVIPWRAGNETPLASIRPMSQSRMAAVQPQQPSGSTAVLLPLHHQQAQAQQQSQGPSQQQQQQQQQQPQPGQQQPQTQPSQQAVHTTGNSSGAGTSSSSASTSTSTAGSGMDAITSSDYMAASSSASPASVVPVAIRQVAVPPTQQATVGPSTSRTEEASAESTQDMEVDAPERQGGTSAQQGQQLQSPVQPSLQQAQLQQPPPTPQAAQQQPPPPLQQQAQAQQATPPPAAPVQQQQATPRESQSTPVQAHQGLSPQSQAALGALAQQTPPQQVVGQAQAQATPHQQLTPQASQAQQLPVAQPLPTAQPMAAAQQQQQPPQQQQAQPQQAVAMVLPRERVEQQQVQQQVPQQVHVVNNPPQPAQAQQVQPPQVSVPSAAGPSQQASPAAAGMQVQQEQSVIVASSQQASSSSTVTTSQSGVKRPREVEGDSSTSRAGLGEGIKMAPQLKRSRVGPVGGDSFQAPAESSAECSGIDVEYQVPTSSQRDQEDDIIVVTSEEEEDEEGAEDEEDDEPDDGPEFQPDEDEDNEEAYEMETYDREDRDMAMANYDDVEGPDIDDENGGEQDNEVEIIDDSNEVPNQPGSSSSSSGGPPDAAPHVGSSASGEQVPSATATHILPLQQQSQQPQGPQQPQQPQDQQQSSSEATSSGATNQSDNGNSSSSSSSNGGPSGSSNNQVSSQGTPVSLGFVPRSRTSVPPLNRQQLVLGYGDDGGDDGIVPSTPTLFVPRRTDGFGEAVSSPQVPSAGRFTFSESNPPAVRAVPCTPTLFGTRRVEGYSDAFRAMSVRHFTFSEAPTPPSHTGVAQVVCEGMDDTRVDLSQLEDPGTGRSVPTTPLQVSPQGDIAANDLAAEVGQSSESDNVDASGSVAGPSSLPSIAVSMADHQPVECEAPAAQDALDIEMENEQRLAGGDGVEMVGEQADEPEEVMVLDLEEESADGVSSEGSKPPQPSQSQQALDLELEEGREAEASEPNQSVNSPQGSPHGSPHGRGSGQQGGSGTARRSQTGPRFSRRGGRGNQRPTPIVWNEPGSTSPRSMGDGPPRGRGMPLMPMMPMARGMPLDPRGFSARGQRARRGRKPYGGNQFNMPY